jgi:hypothetical protein
MPELPTLPQPEAPTKDRPKSGKLIKDHVRRNRAGYAKLVGAITALTTAITGYLELERNNRIVYQTLAAKVNLMAEELSHLKGQNELMLIFLQAKLGGEIMPPEKGPLPRGENSDKKSRATSSPTKEESNSLTRRGPRAERLPDEAPAKPQRRVIFNAFQELPDDLEGLMKAQKALDKM